VLQWNEVDAAQFDQYPAPQQKQPDDLDRVMDALAAGKTVEITVNNESDVRGRRMALGRRAKQRGFGIEMRYAANKIIVRRSNTPIEAGGAPGHDPAQVKGARRTRTRPSAQTSA
jgi:hypothetical protein